MLRQYVCIINNKLPIINSVSDNDTTILSQ